MTDALFDLDTPAPDPAEKLSYGRRLTRRQRAQLAAGVHPLTRGPLHPDAAPAEPRDAPGLRCGGRKAARADRRRPPRLPEVRPREDAVQPRPRHRRPRFLVGVPAV
jgi:hypothetical protein